MSNLQTRIVSSVVLIVAVMGVTWLGGTAFAMLAAAISGAIFYEWTRMSRGEGSAGHHATAAVLLGVVLILLLVGVEAKLIFGAAAIAILLSALDAKWRRQGLGTTAGLSYAALSGISLALLRDGDSRGLAAILFLFATVWVTDIMAYFVGRSLGGPKLAPAISPGKTWSGAIGGAIGGVLAGAGAAAATGYSEMALAGAVAFVLSVVSQVGDLFESWIKRRHGVKDSSQLIPGHGGVMDRVDGLVAAAFALYVIGALLGGAGRPAHGLFPI
ncbi:phosphatidate cytidylyltransferase [Mesorhizobium sp. 1B3]|uniref:phosphatidate cytidylyltransferase n=1 Tax=Mesorhizobium sp. 1B3 TaxID=3243599 RepID=UPI003D999672